MNKRSVMIIDKENEIERRRKEIARQKEAREKQVQIEVFVLLKPSKHFLTRYISMFQAEQMMKKQQEFIVKERLAMIKRDRDRYRSKLTENYPDLRAPVVPSSSVFLPVDLIHLHLVYLSRSFFCKHFLSTKFIHKQQKIVMIQINQINIF